MGQIANQMALELFFRIKERIKEKKKQKKRLNVEKWKILNVRNMEKQVFHIPR